jgi:transposase-like protein
MIGPAKEGRKPPMSKVPKTKKKRQRGKQPKSSGVQTALFEWVVAQGLEALNRRLEEERTAVCGPRSRKNPERKARRMGHAPGELVMGGRKVSAWRPRARTLAGEEVRLPSWEQFSAEDPLTAHVIRQMLLGVTTRGYGRGLEPASPELETRGTSRSAVSRRFVAATQESLDAFLNARIDDFDLVALLLDGIHIGGHVVLVALGIDSDGKKRVLGIHEGATENEVATTALLTSLRDRGIRTDRSVFVGVDGAKALHKAVKSVFGKLAVIQRCQVHKMRNVLEHLPKKRRELVRASMRKAWRAPSADDALRQLEALAKSLQAESPSAAASVREGAAETVTVLRLNLPAPLERTLRTTNAIENLMGSVRRTGRNVKRWRDGTMVMRWAFAAVDKAAKSFRRIRGHEGLKTLVGQLRKRDESLSTSTAAAA